MRLRKRGRGHGRKVFGLIRGVGNWEGRKKTPRNPRNRSKKVSNSVPKWQSKKVEETGEESEEVEAQTKRPRNHAEKPGLPHPNRRRTIKGVQTAIGERSRLPAKK